MPRLLALVALLSSISVYAAAPADTDPNDAFVATNKGLYRIRAGQVQALDLGGCASVGGVVVDKQGRAWVWGKDGVFRSAGLKLQELTAPFRPHRLDLARGGDKVWALGLNGRDSQLAVASLDGKWTTVTVPSDGRNNELSVDVKGRAWVKNSKGLWMREGEEWKEVVLEGEKLSPLAPALAQDESGAVFVHTQSGKWVEWKDGAKGTRSMHFRLVPVPRPGGGLALVDDQAPLVRFVDAAGKTERTVELEGRALLEQGVSDRQAAVDGQGRTWLATRYGLIVIRPDGSVEQWEPGRTAVEGAPMFVAVGGKGPETPKLAPAIRANVTGTLPGGENKRVELCAGGIGYTQGASREFLGRTPCDGKRVRLSAHTDAKGVFRFKDVPPYELTLVAPQTASKWSVHKLPCCTDLKAGETRDLGTLTP